MQKFENTHLSNWNVWLRTWKFMTIICFRKPQEFHHFETSTWLKNRCRINVQSSIHLIREERNTTVFNQWSSKAQSTNQQLSISVQPNWIYNQCSTDGTCSFYVSYMFHTFSFNVQCTYGELTRKSIRLLIRKFPFTLKRVHSRVIRVRRGGSRVSGAWSRVPHRILRRELRCVPNLLRRKHALEGFGDREKRLRSEVNNFE